MNGAPRQILYWRETTDAQSIETGIQRVTRHLADGLERLGTRLVGVGYDPQNRLIRPLGFGACPWTAKADFHAEDTWLLLPEIPMTVLGLGLDPVQLARAYGLRSAAIVHDLIPMRLPHLYPPETVALFRRYYRMFANADLVLSTTQLVAGHLREHLTAEGLHVPEIMIVPLPAQLGEQPRVVTPPPRRGRGAALRLLTVSTWEPRKNLPRLLRAVRLARERSSVPIAVTLVGLRGHYPNLDAEIGALLADLPGSSAHHKTSDSDLAALYAQHHVSLYPSCEEGFGMPVLESLWLGRPCLCHAGSAMLEVAPGRGTLAIDMSDETTIAITLTQLATRPEYLENISKDILNGALKCWNDYAGNVRSHF